MEAVTLSPTRSPLKESVDGHSPLHRENCRYSQLANLLDSVLRVKRAKKAQVDEQRKTLAGRLNPTSFDGDLWLTIGNVLNVFFSALGFAKAFVHYLATTQAFQICFIAVGIAGGVANIIVGVYCIVQGVKELRKNHRLDGYRLLCDGVGMILIGVILIVGPILSQLCPNAWITLALTHPALLSLLFVFVALFVSIEIFSKLAPIVRGNDLGRQLLQAFLTLERGCHTADECRGQVEKILEYFFCKTLEAKELVGDTPVRCSIEKLRDLLEQEEIGKVNCLLCAQMDAIEGEIGVTLAIEVFQQIVDGLHLAAAAAKLDVDKRIEENMEESGGEWDIRIESQLQVIHTQCNNNFYAERSEKIVSLPSLPQGEWVCCCGGSCDRVVARLAFRHYKVRIRENNVLIRKAYRAWVRDLWLRAVQQGSEILGTLLGGFSIGLHAALFVRAAEVINGFVYALLCVGNCIPCVLDLFMPYTRNVPISIAGVRPQELSSS